MMKMTFDKEKIRAWLRKNVAADRSMSMLSDPPPASRLELVRVWLEDNVFRPSTPKEIAVYDIEFDWDSLSGTFRLALDNCEIAEPFEIRIDIAGKVQCTPPMFYSPLGAPASYAAVELDDSTMTAVIRALESCFPRIRGYGVYSDLGLEIYGDSTLEERVVDRDDLEQKKAALEFGGLRIVNKVELLERLP